MANIQTTIPFTVRKKTSLRLLSKSAGKENANQGNLNVQDSPTKSSVLGEKCDFKSSLTKSTEKKTSKRRSPGEDESSPPKQNVSVSSKSPSQIIKGLKITSPGKKEQKPVNKELFPTEENKTKARQALHSALPCSLPEREDKLKEIVEILQKNLKEKTSATIYISGAPGTGKSATINTIISQPQFSSGYKIVYVNCTGLRSAKAIYNCVACGLGLKTLNPEKACLTAIEKYIRTSLKFILLVLDEMDQLETRDQKVLYRVFEWAGKGQVVLVGIANALDLTTRTLPRLSLKLTPPHLIHFPPYTKDQITNIIQDRLIKAGVGEVFSGGALQMLAAKVASVSGDIRRALDLARRVVDTSSKGNVSLKDVMTVFGNVYSTSQTLANCEEGDEYPLQQKLLISSLLLIKKHAKCKEVTIGKLHDVYKKICSKRNISFIELSEFVSLVQLVESRGTLHIQGKTKNRLSKIILQWDEQEISNIFQDKHLLAIILADTSCLPGV